MLLPEVVLVVVFLVDFRGAEGVPTHEVLLNGVLLLGAHGAAHAVPHVVLVAFYGTRCMAQDVRRLLFKCRLLHS